MLRSARWRWRSGAWRGLRSIGGRRTGAGRATRPIRGRRMGAGQAADPPRQARRAAREMLNAIFYLLSTGCQWGALTKDLPPKSTVWDYFSRWGSEGTLERIRHALCVAVREQAGREASPVTAIIDSQTAKATGPKGAPRSTRPASTRPRGWRAQARPADRHARPAAGGGGPSGRRAGPPRRRAAVAAGAAAVPLPRARVVAGWPATSSGTSAAPPPSSAWQRSASCPAARPKALSENQNFPDRL
jgi:transposase